jgi:predicted hydrocarbon binding protein
MGGDIVSDQANREKELMSDKETTNDLTGNTPDSTFEYPIERYYIFECASKVFQSLLSEVGANRTLEAAKGYSKVWGMQLASMAKQRFGLKGSELEDVALPYYWVHYGTSFGHIKPMEIRDGKAIVELYACPVTIINAPPEICIAMSHYISEGLCQAVNPEYEFIYTHHLSNHDGRCRYIVKKKSSKADLDDLGSLQKTIPLNLSQDEVNMVSGNVCFASLNIFSSVSIDLIGSERTLELALPQARELGVKVGKNLIGGSGGNGNIETIRDKLDYLSSIQNQIGTPTILTSTGLEKEIKECPYKGSPPEVCKLLAAISNGVCEVINPDYEFAYDRMMSKGDSTCHWVVRKKREPEKEKLSRPRRSPRKSLRMTTLRSSRSDWRKGR